MKMVMGQDFVVEATLAQTLQKKIFMLKNFTFADFSVETKAF
jgi:hypothetical protein